MENKAQTEMTFKDYPAKIKRAYILNLVKIDKIFTKDPITYLQSLEGFDKKKTEYDNVQKLVK